MNQPVRVQEIETSVGGGFTVSLVGALPFVLPIGVTLGDRLETSVGLACGLAGTGSLKAATAILHHIERQLGVTPELHIAGVLAAASWIAAANRDDGERSAVSAADRARVLMDPIRRRPITGAADLALADAALQREVAVAATKAKDPRRAVNALAEARELESRASNAQRIVCDAAWVEGAEAETVALRSARGDVFGQLAADDGRFEAGMAPRTSVRDGLVLLWERGTVSLNQARTGAAYRTMLQSACAGLGSQMAESGGAKGSDPEQMRRMMGGLKRARSSITLTRIDYEVARIGRRELRVLRWVAGMSGSINSLSTSGQQRLLNTDALLRALDRAAVVMWNARDLRIAGN